MTTAGSRSMKALIHALIPLLVFPCLSCAAVYFILYQSLFQNGVQFKMSTVCEPGPDPHPCRLPYTNIADSDKVLCGIVAFFHALIDPAHNSLLAVLFSALGIIVLIPFLEAARNEHPFALRMPTVVGVLFQLASMGVVIPIYALLFVITRTASIRPSTTSPAKINQGNAEALLFGFLLGYVLPTALMVFFVRPSVTAVWQGFPFLFALAIFAHKLIRPPSRLVQSGHTTIVVTLVFTLFSSALLHAVYVWPVLTDTAVLRAMFMPVVDVLDPAATSLADGVVQFIKWDIIFSIGSVQLATFWIADGILDLVGILVWYGIANIAFGPTAAVAGVFLWRERRLNGGSSVEKVTQKTE